MFWDKDKETLGPDDLAKLQLKRLKKTLKSAENVEFYRKQFAESGIRSSDIRTLDDVRKLPFTKKQDLRGGYPFGFLALAYVFGVLLFSTALSVRHGWAFLPAFCVIFPAIHLGLGWGFLRQLCVSLFRPGKTNASPGAIT